MSEARAAATPRSAGTLLVLALVIVLLSFSANSLMTRHVVRNDLLEADLLSEVRFIAGALMLVLIAVARRTPRDAVPRRRHVLPAFWLGAYAMLISFGYQHIGAAAGTFVFYAAVLISLVAVDAASGAHPSTRRVVSAFVALAGLGVLASAQLSTITPLGVALLTATGVSWGLYTAVGRGTKDPLALSTGNFVLLALALAVPTALRVTGVFGATVVTGEGIAWAVLMGAGTTACAYPIWYWCLRHINATQAGLTQLAIPIITGVAAVALLDEPFSLRLGVAAALVVLGLALGVTPPRRTAP